MSEIQNAQNNLDQTRAILARCDETQAELSASDALAIDALRMELKAQHVDAEKALARAKDAGTTVADAANRVRELSEEKRRLEAEQKALTAVMYETTDGDDRILEIDRLLRLNGLRQASCHERIQRGNADRASAGAGKGAAFRARLKTCADATRGIAFSLREFGPNDARQVASKHAVTARTLSDAGLMRLCERDAIREAEEQNAKLTADRTRSKSGLKLTDIPMLRRIYDQRFREAMTQVGRSGGEAKMAALIVELQGALNGERQAPVIPTTSHENMGSAEGDEVIAEVRASMAKDAKKAAKRAAVEG